jgi:radical SAM protein with 4Fe4S-binding SPASM domain
MTASSVPNDAHPFDLLREILNSDGMRRARLRREARSSLVACPERWLHAWFVSSRKFDDELTRTLRSDPLLVFETRWPHRPLVQKAKGDIALEQIFLPSRLQSALRAVVEGVAHAPDRLPPLLQHLAGLHQRLAVASPPLLPESIQRETVIAYRQSEDARFPPQVSLAPSYGCSRGCSYCHVRTEAGAIQETPSLASVLQALDVIAGGNTVQRVALFGGEPTELPILFDLIDGIRDRGLRFYVATHGIASPETFRRLLAVPELEMITLHVATDSRYTPEQLYTLRTNIRSLATANAQAIVRFNLLPSAGSTELLKWSLEKLTHAHLAIAVPFPNQAHQNEHVGCENLLEFGDRLLDFVRDTARWFGGRRMVLAKPFPPCALRLSALMDVLEYFDFRAICELGRGRFPSQITVQPDLTVAPCMALLAPKRLVRRPMPLALLQQEVTALTSDLFETSFANRCDDCSLKYSGVCQGGCFAYVQ